MLRLTAQRLRASLGSLGSRSISTSLARLEGEAAPSGPKEFTDTWVKSVPSTLEVPQFTSSFGRSYQEGESQADGDKFPVNFYTPNSIVSETTVDLVLLPGFEGYFGIKANHVPYIAQLKPGLVELHNGAEVSKYFISGGFAFVHPNSVTDIAVVTAATLDQFDPVAVKTALQAAASSPGTDDYDQAVNRAAQELYQALDAALEAK